MLCFVMALKSKAVSKDWERVSQLFENSLRSAYNQIDPDIKVIAVCHETPQLTYNYDQRVEIINVDFAPPQKIITKLTMQDKWRKLAVGMVRAGELHPDFMMIMDADDLVSQRLSQYAHAHGDVNGWILKQGYRYKYGSRWIEIDHNFNCGTNAIINSKLIQFPEDPTEISDCTILTHGHTVIEKSLTEIGTPLLPLPFPGAMYIHGHGDNDSHSDKFTWHGIRFLLGSIRTSMNLIKNKRLLSQKTRTEFSLN